jgi:carboxymethylenebutenolidase
LKAISYIGFNWQVLLEIIMTVQASNSQTNLTPAQAAMQELWEAHVQYEFGTHNTEDALATMVEDAYVNHIPVMTGGVGKPAVREFYSKYFIPQIPPDMELTPISRTIGTDQLVDEMVVKFTHTIRMDWMLPGIAPTGKRVEVPVVAIIRFRDGKIAHEHLYWDQATVLLQLGLIDATSLPIVGAASAEKLLNLRSQWH